MIKRCLCTGVAMLRGTWLRGAFRMRGCSRLFTAVHGLGGGQAVASLTSLICPRGYSCGSCSQWKTQSMLLQRNVKRARVAMKMRFLLIECAFLCFLCLAAWQHPPPLGMVQIHNSCHNIWQQEKCSKVSLPKRAGWLMHQEWVNSN